MSAISFIGIALRRVILWVTNSRVTWSMFLVAVEVIKSAANKFTHKTDSQEDKDAVNEQRRAYAISTLTDFGLTENQSRTIIELAVRLVKDESK